MMKNNRQPEIKKFRHGIMSSGSGQVTVYGLDGAQWTYSKKSASSLSQDGVLIIDNSPVTENDPRFISKTEATSINVNPSSHHVEPGFFSSPVRPVHSVRPSLTADELSAYGFCMMKIGNYNNMGSFEFYVNPEKNTVTMIHAGEITTYNGRNVSLINSQVVIDNIPVRHNDPRIIRPPMAAMPTHQIPENSTQTVPNHVENNNAQQKTSIKGQVLAGILSGVVIGIESLLACTLLKKNATVTTGKNEHAAFERYSPFFITTVFPIVEELIFRKYLPRWMNKGFKKIGFSSDMAEGSSMMLSNLFFAAGHNDSRFIHFTDGMVLSLLNKYYAGSQVPNSVAHIVSNFLAYLALRPLLPNTSSSNIESFFEVSLPKPG